MLLRFAPLAAALAAAAAVLPCAATAAVTQVLPLDSSSNGIAVAADGKIHVIEPFAGKDAIFAPDGTRVGTATLPAGATNATRGPDGDVWVATASGIARVTSTGTVIATPTALACAPAGLASDGTLLAYTAPSDGGSCAGSHGLGELNASGGSILTDTTFPDAYSLALAGGKLYAPQFDADTIGRYRYNGAIVPEATVAVPTGSGPDGIAAGQDGKMYVSLYNSGQVARFDPRDGSTTATIVASGLGRPFGIAAGPSGDVTVASHDDGRLVRIGPPGIPHDTALPAGFHPQQVAISGTDVWVTDDTAAHVARVVDAAPVLQIGTPTATALPLQIDPQGNDTSWSVVATRDHAVAFGVTSGRVDAGIGAVPVSVDLNALSVGAQHVYGRAIAGDYTLSVSVMNRWGSTIAAAPATVHLDDLSAPSIANPPATTPRPAAAPRAPKFDELIRAAAVKRCVANRRVVLLTLRRQPAGRAIASVTVKVGRHKAKRYLARQLRHGLSLKGLPARGSYRVAVTVRLANGRSYKKTYTYKACKAKR